MIMLLYVSNSTSSKVEFRENRILILSLLPLLKSDQHFLMLLLLTPTTEIPSIDPDIGLRWAKSISILSQFRLPYFTQIV